MSQEESERVTDLELIDSPILDDKATKWVNEIVPAIYLQFERAGISYNDEMICHLLADGFKIGYATCFRELRGQEKEQ
jgi:hypothetical protein